MLDYQEIAKAILSNRDEIMEAISRYLAKVDDDLAKSLDKDGFAEAKTTVDKMTAFQNELADLLNGQTKEVLDLVREGEEDGIDYKELKVRIDNFMQEDSIDYEVSDSAERMFDDITPELATAYIQQAEGDMVVEKIRQSTAAWIQEWSAALGALTKISTHNAISKLIERTITAGDDIPSLARKIMEGGWRNEEAQARRIAITEVLRAHSVAREEAIAQSPATDRKEWRHSGGHKIQPRFNHVTMDGQIVDKDKPFELVGNDGNTYYPMFPRDPLLPAGESINCRCIHRGIVNDEILGLPLEERKRLQAEAVEAADKEWQAKQVDEKNNKGYNEDEKVYDNLVGDEINEFFREQKSYQKWFNNLSEQNKKDIEYYTMSPYEAINSSLRQGVDSWRQDYIKYSGDEIYAAKYADEIIAQAKEVENAIDGYTAEKSFRTYRGIMVSGKYYDNLKVGDKRILDKAFMSSSMDKEQAQSFIGNMGGKKILLDIKVKQGAKVGAFIGDLSDMPEEKEFLFKPSTEFKIIGIDNKDGIEVISVEAE